MSEDTEWLLDEGPETDRLSVTCYPKSEFGWYIYCDGLSEAAIDHLPNDLKAVVFFAKSFDCSIICFDCDAVPLSCLHNYYK